MDSGNASIPVRCQTITWTDENIARRRLLSDLNELKS